ncbi:hypothetical protein ACFLZS_01260 [Patescibacteria group bacterium]
MEVKAKCSDRVFGGIMNTIRAIVGPLPRSSKKYDGFSKELLEAGENFSEEFYLAHLSFTTYLILGPCAQRTLDEFKNLSGGEEGLKTIANWYFKSHLKKDVNLNLDLFDGIFSILIKLPQAS